MTRSAYLTEEHELLRNIAREFADREVAPFVPEAERQERTPPQLFRKLGEAGYLGMRIPEEYGGTNAGLLAEAIVEEEISRVCCGVASAMMPQFLVGGLISRCGTEDQKCKYLPGIVSGDLIVAIAITEPSAGSDVRAILTKAERQGNGFLINGAKTYITNGPDAELVLVVAYTDRSAGTNGISLFLVERGTPGFEVSRKLEKVGNRASSIGELLFQDCLVPYHALLGNEEGRFRDLLKAITASRVIFAARSVGVCQAALDVALEHARNRVAFGQPIGQFQAIQFKLADMATSLETARLLTHHAAWLHDQGLPCVKEAAMAKLLSSEAAVNISNEALQIHGGLGYMMESLVQRLWRDARLLTISEGTSEIQRQTIAKQLGL